MNIPYSGGLGLEAEMLPAGESSAVRVASRRHHAWQSAMEQAQLAGWFKPGLDTGHAHEQVECSVRASPTVVRARSGVLPVDRAGRSASVPIPRSVSSLAVSQTLHAAGEMDQTLAGADGAGGVPLGGHRDGLPGMAAASGPGGHGGPAVERATLQLAAQVWRQIRASIPADIPHAVGMAMPAGLAAAPSEALPGEPAAAAPGMQPLRTPVASVAAAVLRPAALPMAAEAGAVAGPDDAPAQPDEPAAVRSGASRVTAALPPGQAPDDEAAMAMRVHVAWSEQGASVWLGVNHERLASLPALARQLDQWLLASGVKLASLVCNGRTIPTLFSQRRSE